MIRKVPMPGEEKGFGTFLLYRKVVLKGKQKRKAKRKRENEKETGY